MNLPKFYVDQSSYKTIRRCLAKWEIVPPWVRAILKIPADSVVNLGPGGTESAGVALNSVEVEQMKYIKNSRLRREQGGGYD